MGAMLFINPSYRSANRSCLARRDSERIFGSLRFRRRKGRDRQAQDQYTVGAQMSFLSLKNGGSSEASGLVEKIVVAILAVFLFGLLGLTVAGIVHALWTGSPNWP